MSSVLNKKRPLSHSFDYDWEENKTDPSYGVHKRPVDLSTRSKEIQALVHDTRKRIDRAPNNKVKQVIFDAYDERVRFSPEENPFPSMDMCSFNTQALFYFSSQSDLLYHESPIIYQWEDGRWDTCFHSYATRQDGTKIDLTYDFDYIALDTFTLSSCPKQAKRLVRRWLETQKRALSNYRKALRRGKFKKALKCMEEGVHNGVSSFIAPVDQWTSDDLVRLVVEKGIELGPDVLPAEDVERLSKILLYENTMALNRFTDTVCEVLVDLHNNETINIGQYEANTPVREMIRSNVAPTGRLRSQSVYGGVR